MKNSHQNLTNEPVRIALSCFGKLRMANQDEIICLQSDNNYSRIFLSDNSVYVMCRTLKDYETELDSRLFLRCHRSYLINKAFVKEIESHRRECLLLSNGLKVPIARRKSLKVKKLLFSTTVY